MLHLILMKRLPVVSISIMIVACISIIKKGGMKMGRYIAVLVWVTLFMYFYNMIVPKNGLYLLIAIPVLLVTSLSILQFFEKKNDRKSNIGISHLNITHWLLNYIPFNKRTTFFKAVLFSSISFQLLFFFFQASPTLNTFHN